MRTDHSRLNVHSPLEGHAEGRIEIRAAFTLRVLEKHGIDVPDDIRERITSCSDLDTLTLWFDRSLTASAAEDLFVESPEAPQPQPRTDQP